MAARKKPTTAKIILIGVILRKEKIIFMVVRIGIMVKIIKETEERMFLGMGISKISWMG